jgi:hypothetical protein
MQCKATSPSGLSHRIARAQKEFKDTADGISAGFVANVYPLQMASSRRAHNPGLELTLALPDDELGQVFV